MAAGKLYRTAKLVGCNQFDDIVCSVRLSLEDYYDGEHACTMGNTRGIRPTA